MLISIVSPAFNEEENILPLWEETKKAMKGRKFELIVVDDCSTDGTFEELKKIKDKRLKALRLKERKGQSFALYKGIKEAEGEVIATIDADLQNKPEEIPKMIEELRNAGCVCGWRQGRKESLEKKALSSIGTLLNNLFFGLKLRDNNCPLRVFKRECISRVKYFENFHRFVPAIIKIQGFKIKEVKIRHFERKFGISKYGIFDRIFGNIKTLLVLKFKGKELIEWN